MLSYFYSSFPVINHDKKDSFYPRVIGQKKPAFFNVWIFGARKKYRATTVCLLQELCHFTLKPYCIQQILLSQNTFLFCHASLGIFLFDILLFFTQKSPTLFAKKGGKMKVFFNFFDFFHDFYVNAFLQEHLVANLFYTKKFLIHRFSMHIRKLFRIR